VLVEGPPDADALLPLAADAATRPPVALLLYVPDEPRRAVYYPFAEFSPEWVAVRTRSRVACRSGSWTCPWPTSSRSPRPRARRMASRRDA
jgi:hypothetical protein